MKALQRYLAAAGPVLRQRRLRQIMADIEARVAELLQERLDGRQVVTTAEVDHVIGVLKPEDISEEAGAFVTRTLRCPGRPRVAANACSATPMTGGWAAC